MKKIVAVLLCVSIITSQAFADVPVRKPQVPVSTASRLGQQAASYVLNSSANAAKSAGASLPALEIPSGSYRVDVPQMPDAEQINLQDNILRVAAQASGAENLSFEKIIYRANNGQTAFLPQAILNLQNQGLREQAMRSAFVTASAAGEASAEQLEIARQFWRRDFVLKLSDISILPTLSRGSVDDILPVMQIFQDAAALALLGTEQDVRALKTLLAKTDGGSFEPFSATLLARGLLCRGDWNTLEKFFILYDGEFPELQNGIAAYAVEQDLPLHINTTGRAGSPLLSQEFTNLLQAWGPVLANATDQSLTATRQWMAWAQNRPQAPVIDTKPAPKPAAAQSPVSLNDVELLPEIEAAAAQITAAALPTFGQTETAAPKPAFETATDAVAEEIPTAQADAATKLIQAGRVAAAHTIPSVQEQDTLLAKMQRIMLYLTAMSMGFEVAAPVVSNFGDSFGLSFENNSLVIAATYAPYSLGSLFSNWLKKYLGRKGSMNLGLAMMLTGFAGGVSWAGLDGSFIAEADPMMQFYKALACITLASFGGVFIHNSIGPIMTELNHWASELVRQKRNTYTEFSRAAGMVASFLFPYIATKLLGQDWSFTFAMPIPFTLAALVGLNLVRIPNTRPVVEQVAQATQAAGQVEGTLWERLKNSWHNNQYVSLFREDPSALSLVGGLAIYNGVEVTTNNAFLYLLPSLTKDPSAQYLFGLVQFAVPFLLGRYLARCFLTWFPNTSLSKATTLISSGLAVSLLPFVTSNVYALTTTLFLSEIGISTLFTLSFARTAKNPATMDRLTTMIVASALSCAVGPVMLSSVTQMIMEAGFSSGSATTIGMLGIPAALTLLAAKLFSKVETDGTRNSPGAVRRFMRFIKNSFYIPKVQPKNN